MTTEDLPCAWRKIMPQFITRYAVTVSPGNPYLNKIESGDMAMNAKLFLRDIAGYLFPIRKNISIYGCFELGDKKRLHTHFELRFKGLGHQVTFDRDCCPKMRYNIGFVDLSTGTKVDNNWIDVYMQKEKEYMSLLDIPPFTEKDLQPFWDIQHFNIKQKQAQAKLLKRQNGKLHAPPKVYQIATGNNDILSFFKKAE